MPYIVPIETARAWFPEYIFISSLTPSEQKAAFHVRKDGQDLCLKLIAPTSDRERIDREILVLQGLSHPNVVKLVEYTYSTTNGVLRHFSVEEFVEGVDLSMVIETDKPLDTKRVASLFSALCDGLYAIHKMGVVHRDLKPSNIRVRHNGTPVIIDFGISRLLTLPDLTSTSDGAQFGTPLYFAPEQFTGTKRDIDHRTDLFALGILLYQALVGEHPFYEPTNNFDGLQKAVCESTDFLSSPGYSALPDGWQSIISRLLEKERSRRPQSAEQVSRLIRKLG